MAEQLTLRARALTASDNARRQLLADVSHELMTPLTAVRGYVEILGRPQGEIDQSTRNHHIHIVIEETRRLESITEDLLDLARLEGAQ
jgi:signal transduction histidine kinase